MASYTDDQRKAARELYQQRGSRHAAEALHIPQRTIQQWASTEGWGTRLASVSSSGEQHAQRIRLGWAVRKQALADDAAEAAAATINLYLSRVRKGTIYGLHDLARSFALFTERAAEMSSGMGGADAPTLPPEQAVGRINAVLDVLEERKAAGGEPNG
jgi:hypothetical protein